MSKAAVSLKQLAESKAEGIQKATYFKVKPDKVEFEEGFNLREEGPELDAHLEKLYQAMKSGAYVPPIDVKVVDGRILARDGHCRTRVARRLWAEGVEYQLEARQVRGNEVDDVLHMLGSDQGKSFTPLEQGRGFLRLTRYGLNVAEIVRKTHLHRTTVDNGLILASAPVEVQHMLSRGEVSAEVVVTTIKKHGSKALPVLQALVSKVVEGGGTKVTKKHVSGPRVPAKVAISMVDSVRAIRSVFFDSTDEELMAMDDEAMVPVPAKDLKALLAAAAQCAPVTEGEEL